MGFTMGAERQPAHQFPVGIEGKIDLHPAPVEAGFRFPAFDVDADEAQHIAFGENALGALAVAEVPFEGEIDEEDIEPHEAGDGPGAQGHEEDAAHQIDGRNNGHDRDETLTAQGAVRGQRDRPVLPVAHGHKLRNDSIQDQPECCMPARKSRRPTAEEIEAMFRRFQIANPEPKGELQSLNPFTFLVAVVLSAQATDESVNRATGPLFRTADTPEKMVALGEEKLASYIKTIGLYRGKAKNVIALSRQLIEKHGSEVPPERTALEALPGVGRKTANVVLNVIFGEHTIAVDTHLFRLGNRLGIAPGETPLEVEQKLLKVVPPAYLRHAHHWLILHGRYVCKARKPECWHCLIADLCRFTPKTNPGEVARLRR